MQPHTVIPVGLVSWNPAVACIPTVTTIEQIIGSVLSINGGADQSGGAFAQIPDKRSITPPCSGLWNGQTRPTFVEIHGVRIQSFINSDACNGFCDESFNLESLSVFPEPQAYLHRIHCEIDCNWQFNNIAPPLFDPLRPSCGVTALESSKIGTLLDVQGFVYWDPGHLIDSWHSFSGWELHPLTAWRLAV